MLIWLDNKDNVKGHPNENYAREIMELFTMGEGNGYTEQDIREALGAAPFPAITVTRELVRHTARPRGMVEAGLVAVQLADALAVLARDATAALTTGVAVAQPGKLRALQLGRRAPVELAFDLMIDRGHFPVEAAEIARAADRPFGVVEPLYGVAAVAIKSRRSGLGGAGENGQGAGDT